MCGALPSTRGIILVALNARFLAFEGIQAGAERSRLERATAETLEETGRVG